MSVDSVPLLTISIKTSAYSALTSALSALKTHQLTITQKPKILTHIPPTTIMS